MDYQVSNSHSNWLRQVEEQTAKEQPCAELWPRTPVLNIQAEIWQRCGASDWNIRDNRCRAGNILRALQEMQENDILNLRPAILDLFCGDGLVLWQLQRSLALSSCFGIDIRDYPEHELGKRAGVRFYHIPVQLFVEYDPFEPFDVLIMLNTFRGWEKADLSPTDSGLQYTLMTWMKRNARYCIVTVTDEQVTSLQSDGWWTFDIGPGEDDTRLIGMFLGRDR